ncbi:MAG: cupredoxin family copper-binding protein [Pseudomonadota bacterium]
MTSRRTLIIAGLALFAMPISSAMAADHQVTIKSFKFSPAQISVAAGDTITFINEDGAPHTGTALDGSFDTGRLNKGESGTVTLANAGTVEFKCSFHPNMKGTVTVN